MILLNNKPINITMFSDNTSQVWKLDNIEKSNVIRWEYENEAEVFHFFQLLDLLKGSIFKIEIPYLPFARQDKVVDNHTSFALRTFLKLLDKFVNNECFDCGLIDSESYSTAIHTIDAHNPHILPWYFKNDTLDNIIIDTELAVKADVICYPDKGANQRGYVTITKNTIVLDKKRNQLTGHIEGLQLDNDYNNADVKDKVVLIVDDLCDRGGTFIMAAKLLLTMGAKEVNLYTTHGLYSGGTKMIFDSGINRIFNYKGEVKNEIE